MSVDDGRHQPLAKCSSEGVPTVAGPPSGPVTEYDAVTPSSRAIVAFSMFLSFLRVPEIVVTKGLRLDGGGS